MTVYTLVRLIQSLFNFYNILIIVYCLLSWVPRGGSGLLEDLRGVLDTLVGRFLDVFRRFLPAMMGIDFSPVIAILVLNLVERLVLNIIL